MKCYLIDLTSHSLIGGIIFLYIIYMDIYARYCERVIEILDVIDFNPITFFLPRILNLCVICM